MEIWANLMQKYECIIEKSMTQKLTKDDLAELVEIKDLFHSECETYKRYAKWKENGGYDGAPYYS